MKSKSLVSIFFNEIGTSESKLLGLSYFELGLDSLFDDELLIKIPFFNSLYTLYKGSISISDKLLFRKLWNFIFYLNDIDLEDRTKFLVRVDNNEKQKQKIVVEILNIIDKVDSDSKNRLVAEVFRYYVLDLIDYGEFLDCVHGIKQAQLKDLKLLLMNGDNLKISDKVKLNLLASGLTYIKGAATYSGKLILEVSELGTLLIKIHKNISLKDETS